MLINQSELETLCLNRPATDELTAQVINQLNGIADPLVRYATARTLKSVFDKATENCGAAAVDYCLEHNIGGDCKQFPHENLTFSLDYKCDYDYASNDTDGEKPVGYKEAHLDIVYYQKCLKIAKDKEKTAKETIELLHPNMVPRDPSWTIKFYMKEV